MKVEIWREEKVGKIRGRTVSWDEDRYRAYRLKTDSKGKVLLRDDDDPTSQLWELTVEDIVTDSFKTQHKDDYEAFIEENGEPKDERYK
jgi:hypothetical protein